MIRTYRKKPVQIRAVRWTGRNVGEIKRFAGGVAFFTDGELFIRTLEGRLKAPRGSWIIEGVVGEFYPCDPDIFKLTYEVVEHA